MTQEKWLCTCGAANSGKFCTKCGSPKEKAGSLPEGAWLCECGTVNQKKFCKKCGRPKREEEPAAQEKEQEIVPLADETAEPASAEASELTAPTAAEALGHSPNADEAAETEEDSAQGEEPDEESHQEEEEPDRKRKKIVLIAACLIVLLGLGAFMGIKITKENSYVQAAAKVQDVLTENQETLKKLGEIKADGYPDNAKALSEELSAAMESLDKAAGEFGTAEEPGKYNGTAQSIAEIMSTEKKLLENVKYLLEHPQDKDAQAKLKETKESIGALSELSQGLSLEKLDFSACTELSFLDKALADYVSTAGALERQREMAAAKSAILKNSMSGSYHKYLDGDANLVLIHGHMGTAYYIDKSSVKIEQDYNGPRSTLILSCKVTSLSESSSQKSQRTTKDFRFSYYIDNISVLQDGKSLPVNSSQSMAGRPGGRESLDAAYAAFYIAKHTPFRGCEASWCERFDL